MQLFSRLDFDDENAVHDHVQAMVAKDLSFVREADDYFSFDIVTPEDQFLLQRLRIERLREPEARGIVMFKASTYHGMRECFVD
jgi:hypothetical protein